MNIVIGDVPRVGSAGQYRSDMEPALLEARLLDIRKHRKQLGDPAVGQTERREGGDGSDSPSGQVLTLLIPEGYKIPRGVESGQYRIFLRFVQRNSARV
jgi:hypothetical protein